jgi:ABC-type multidrug transport system fused ATPase/permease subunit
MSDSEKSSIPRMILQAVEDFATIVKGEIDIAKKSLTTSVKKLGLGIGFVISAFILLNVSLLFILIALAYGFIQIGLAGWVSFLLVAAIMVALAIIFILLAVRAFSKVRGIGDASRIGSETKKYLSESVKKPERSSGWTSLN